MGGFDSYYISLTLRSSDVANLQKGKEEMNYE